MRRAVRVLSVLSLVLGAVGSHAVAQSVDLSLYTGIEVPGIVSVANTVGATQGGLLVGASASLPLSNAIRLQIGAQYSRRGVRSQVALSGGTSIGSTAEIINMSYVELPVNFRLSIGSRFKVHLLAGTNVGTVIAAAREVQGESDGSSFSTPDPTPVNFSVEVGGGVSYALSERVGVMADTRYSYGLVEQSDGAPRLLEQTSWQARDLKLITGLTFSL